MGIHKIVPNFNKRHLLYILKYVCTSTTKSSEYHIRNLLLLTCDAAAVIYPQSRKRVIIMKGYVFAKYMERSDCKKDTLFPISL